MHLTVSYLATPTGDDGVALAGALARTFDASVDVVLVVREELADGHPGRAQYQEFLVQRGKDWIAGPVKALQSILESSGATVAGNVLVGESTAQSLLKFAEDKDSDLIVLGGARDGFFGGHVIGPVSSALLHNSPIPVALAPRWYAEDPPQRLTSVTAAVPTRPEHNPLSFALTLASAAELPIRMLSLVSSESFAGAENQAELRQFQISAAEENLAIAARAVPDAPAIESLVADGRTLESALRKLNWNSSDVLVVGSSRFAAPRRIFLGSTGARILAGTDAPVIVVPRGE